MRARVNTLAMMLLLAAGAAAPAAARQAPDYAPMLERVLPAVMTVAVIAADDAPRAFGFATTVEPGARSVYQRMLDLSPYDGSGSGFVTTRAGRRLLVTNAHVIDIADANEIYAFSHTRQRYRMRIVGVDTYRDVAVLEFVDAPGAEIANINIRTVDDLRVGRPVFVVGNPRGALPYTVTSGIISALNRTLTGIAGLYGYLQTDAAVAGGNSGGPLVGANGDVVGLITKGYTGGAQHNFALDARHLNRIVDDIARHGRVQRAYTGVILGQEWLRDGSMRVRIDGTMTGSPAAAALAAHGGSYVVAINNEGIESIYDAIGIFEQLAPGARVTFTVANAAGQRSNVQVTAGTLGTTETAQIGTFMMNNVFGVQVAAGQGASQLTITRAPTSMPDLVFTTDGSSTPPRAGEVIRYGGTATDIEEQIWRLGSLHELGVIARMALPVGLYAISLQMGNSERFAVAEFDPATIL